MPTVLHVEAYRLFFYASDRKEPAHIHVERDDSVAKFWLDPVRLERSGGFGRGRIKDRSGNCGKTPERVVGGLA